MALDPKTHARARPSRPESVIGIAVARFHSELTGPMKDSAVRELEACGVEPEDIHVVWVPGAFELPLAARRLVEKMEVEAVLCLGVVLEGETEHDHWVAHGAVTGIMTVCLEEDCPVMLGVLTCATIEQARARALPVEMGGREDKGREIARAAIETLIAFDDVEEGETGGEGAGAHGSDEDDGEDAEGGDDDEEDDEGEDEDEVGEDEEDEDEGDGEEDESDAAEIEESRT